MWKIDLSPDFAFITPLNSDFNLKTLTLNQT